MNTDWGSKIRMATRIAAAGLLLLAGVAQAQLFMAPETKTVAPP